MLPPTLSPNIEKISLLFVLNVRQNLVILITVIVPCKNAEILERYLV